MAAKEGGLFYWQEQAYILGVVKGVHNKLIAE